MRRPFVGEGYGLLYRRVLKRLSPDKTGLNPFREDATPDDDGFTLRVAVPETQSLTRVETTIRMADPKSTVGFIDQTANNYR